MLSSRDKWPGRSSTEIIEKAAACANCAERGCIARVIARRSLGQVARRERRLEAQVAGFTGHTRIEEDGVFGADRPPTLSARELGLVRTSPRDQKADGHLAQLCHTISLPE